MEKWIERTPPILLPAVYVIGGVYAVVMLIVHLLGFWKCDKCGKWFHVFREKRNYFCAEWGEFICESYDSYCSRCAEMERGNG
jgi:hypothetical protein